MKEASGELSMTAVAVVAIAAIGVLFTTLIWPSMKASIVNRQRCAAASCYGCLSTEKYDDEEGGNAHEKPVKCPNPAKQETTKKAPK